VERYAAHKINKVEYPLPQNTVTVKLTNQLTGEQSTRNLRWDEQVTTEEPLEVPIGENGKITVELASPADEEDRALYRYRITDEATGIDHEGADLEAYETELEGGIDSENLDLFGDRVNKWAYVHAEEIEMAQVELTAGLEPGR
jgi:hypothetical protein